MWIKHHAGMEGDMFGRLVVGISCILLAGALGLRRITAARH
jgi:hypothetical protein